MLIKILHSQQSNSKFKIFEEFHAEYFLKLRSKRKREIHRLEQEINFTEDTNKRY